MIRKIDHVNIVVTDLRSSVSFFEQLGFVRETGAFLEGEWISEVVGYPGVRAEYASLSIPGTETALELIQYDNPSTLAEENVSRPNALGFRHIAFAVRGIETIHHKLTSMNVRTLSDVKVFPKNGKKLFYFLGPDNILLELAEYADDCDRV